MGDSKRTYSGFVWDERAAKNIRHSLNLVGTLLFDVSNKSMLLKFAPFNMPDFHSSLVRMLTTGFSYVVFLVAPKIIDRKSV